MVYIIIASIALTLILTGGVFYYTRRRFDRLLDIVTGLLTTTVRFEPAIHVNCGFPFLQLTHRPMTISPRIDRVKIIDKFLL